MNECVKLFGVSEIWMFMIMLFFFILAELAFGKGSTNDTTIGLIVVFLTLGTSLLIGHFGWQILIIPSSIILLATAWVVWKLLN
jgi:hypothetical protein